MNSRGLNITALRIVALAAAVASASSALGAATNSVGGGETSIAAQTYFREGLLQVQQQKYRSAIRSFRGAIQHDPGLAEAYLNLGACYERLDQFSKGVPFYEKALSLDDANARLHYLYGSALGRNGELAKAITHLERAVYLAPRNVDYLYNLGVGFAAITQYNLAVSSFEQVTTIVSNNSVVWYNLGLAQLRMNRTNEALEAWEHVEIDAPVAAETYYHLAGVAVSRNDETGAMKNVKMALALNPGLTVAEHLKATLLRRAGKYREAADILERLNVLYRGDEVEGELAGLYGDWAHQAYEQEEYTIALHRYRQAGRFAPTDADIQISVARCALAAGRYVLARETLDRVRRYVRGPAQEEAILALREQLDAAASP